MLVDEKMEKKNPKSAITTPLTKLKYTWLSNTKKILHQENKEKILQSIQKMLPNMIITWNASCLNINEETESETHFT